MSREEKINKMIEEIKIRRNDEQYRGGPFPIYHIEFDILNEEIERLNNIIKEARKYIEERYNGEVLTHTFDKCNVGELLEILDKGSDKK